MPLLTQRRWRIAGAIALTACAALALYGKNVDPKASPLAFAVYWSVFLFCLVAALGSALLDFRHIRKQYVRERQDLYRDTLGDESFRRNLSDAHRNSRQKTRKNK